MRPLGRGLVEGDVREVEGARGRDLEEQFQRRGAAGLLVPVEPDLAALSVPSKGPDLLCRGPDGQDPWARLVSAAAPRSSQAARHSPAGGPHGATN